MKYFAVSCRITSIFNKNILKSITLSAILCASQKHSANTERGVIMKPPGAVKRYRSGGQENKKRALPGYSGYSLIRQIRSGFVEFGRVVQQIDHSPLSSKPAKVKLPIRFFRQLTENDPAMNRMPFPTSILPPSLQLFNAG